MSGTKLQEAKQATATALETLRDGVAFAIVAGDTKAKMVYPPKARLETVSASTRAQAGRALGRLDAGGGTAIGSWLTLTNQLIAGHKAQVKHAILLTDGHNNFGTEQEFLAVVDGCRGNFVCDARGVGTGWRADLLLAVAEALQGSAKGLPEPAGLTADFQEVTEAAMGAAAADVVLRVWTPAEARIMAVKQTFPQISALTAAPSTAGPRFTDYPIGLWGNEMRHYHLRVKVPGGKVREERAAARVGVVVGDTQLTEETVWIHWTSDPERSTKINGMVAAANDQAELAETIQLGLDARREGRADVATAKLGRALELAEQYRNDETKRLLANIIDVDKDTGTVRLKPSMSDIDAEMAKLESRKTRRTRPA
jgi:hypothetical protein